MDAPLIPVQITAGDYVQATRIDPAGEGQPDNVTVATFTVTTVNGAGLVAGSPVLGPLDPNAWTIELVTKAPENIALPEQIAEIAVFTRTNEVLHLMGKKEAWRDAETGREVQPEMIHGWRDWEPYAAEADAYREELAVEAAAAELSETPGEVVEP